VHHTARLGAADGGQRRQPVSSSTLPVSSRIRAAVLPMAEDALQPVQAQAARRITGPSTETLPAQPPVPAPQPRGSDRR
jgi:hypothetical protein